MSLSAMDQLRKDYPWTKSPLVSCAPMRLISLSSLATEVSRAGGLGFLGAGSDVSTLEEELEKVKQLQASAQVLREVTEVLPIGIGFILWAGDKLLNDSLPIIARYKPAAVWLFAPSEPEQFTQWTTSVRRVTDGKTKIWIQIGTVKEATEVTQSCHPDVLVVQGQDAGGHGLNEASGLITLLPEVCDAIDALSLPDAKKPIITAAGGILDARSLAAALTLGASAATLGTRYLTAPEANIAPGYLTAILRASDGGSTTARSSLYDTLRGTTDWPARYGGRGVLNETWRDSQRGVSIEENKKLYDEAVNKGGDEGWERLTTYAGTGVGLCRSVKSAARITEEVREECKRVLRSRQM